ncbi:MAG: hypothetical protein II892_08295 [Fibrobacter sp.]|jgi:ABC-type oligopeptide transport system substrate-binding subunit|nr:hypothetical protein [Fibrobacter sp.]
MFFRKLGMAVVFSSAFALIACGDDSSSSSSETVITCNIVSEDPLVLSTNEDGIKSTSTIELKDKRLVETVKFDTDVPSQACQTYKNDTDYGDVSCSGKTIKAISSMELTESEFESIENAFRRQCKQVN